jgi:carbamoyl-phosphate synthase large subunit
MSINVLVTSLGSNTSIGVLKSLRIDANLYLIGTDINPSFQCAGYAFVDEFIQCPISTHSDYVNFIKNVIIQNNVHVIIPIHDNEIEVLSMLTLTKSISCKIASNSNSIVKLCNNKPLINKKVSGIVNVPKTVFKNDINRHPYIIKPINGISSRGILIIEHLDHIINFNEETEFAQEYIEGTEYTVDCYSSYSDKSKFYYSVRERVETKSGMSTKGKILDIPILGEYCEAIHNLLEYKGASNIQFIEKQGNYFFIEINPRFAGGGVLTYLSGYNFPLYTVYELVGKEFKVGTLAIGNQMVRFLSETFFDEKGTAI